MLIVPKPPIEEVPEFYRGYLEQVPDADLSGALHHATTALQATCRLFGPERSDHRYAPGKWSVKEVLLHIADSERIFAYRALRGARGDDTPLPGFDQDAYVPASNADARTWASLLAELDTVRSATLTLFGGLDTAALQRSVIANGHRIQVSGLGWTIAGHALHHAHILRERYTT